MVYSSAFRPSFCPLQPPICFLSKLVSFVRFASVGLWFDHGIVMWRKQTHLVTEHCLVLFAFILFLKDRHISSWEQSRCTLLFPCDRFVRYISVTETHYK